MNVCTHCKTQNNDSANYCRQCGFVFPDVNLQSGNIDNSLVDKVNELQKRVSDAEANSNNSQREISTLNSRVSSLVSSNSSLQNKLTQTERQLSSANNTINTERQKAQNAQKEADNAKKSLSEAESTKSTLHTFYIIALIALGITALVQCNGKQNKESEIFSLQNKQTELEKQVKSLKNKNTELTNTNNSMSNIIQNVSKNSPFIVNDFSVKSNKESYGCSRISSYSNDISCRIRGFSLTTQNITITEKFFGPFGSQTNERTLYLTKNQDFSYDFGNWTVSSLPWTTGNYRFEYYYKGRCIGSKSFTIY